MTPGLIPLAAIAARTAQLDIRCKQCTRFGRVSTTRLLAKYGDDASTWLEDLGRDCPNRDTRSVYERCQIYAPQLAEWF